MDRQIEELTKQGLSRHEIFEQLKKQSGNQMRLANKIATFEPVVSIVGVLLAVAGGVLSYSIKVRLFPHMGFLDVRKDERGDYIFE
ncbi:hypothetical protein [Marinobacter sp. LQ44]|uniref:hypothetical protein n=1 Tax=unclassified Marinobacter TaxID=83889 RepID=UPI000718CD30|nr:hypothetical protein [Marinobacter sp. LQ44]AMQ87916.1 hypothetical protein ASQ50_04065 [Marinobacter sp. LQ44]